MKTQFESIQCSRCHGSGKYSFCERYRDICFKCAGSGIVYSTRGQLALNYFKDSTMVPICDLEIGQVILVESITHGGQSYKYMGKIIEIKRQESPTSFGYGEYSETYYGLSVTTEHPKYGKSTLTTKDDHKIQVRREDDKTRLQKALEYQESLTKSGKPRKSKGNKSET